MSGDGQKPARMGHFPEVLKLAFVDGLGIRAIARQLRVGRKTVRRILAKEGERRKRHGQPSAAPRATLLSAYEGAIRQMLSDVPEMKAPAVLERLRPLGYVGGITVLRDRLRPLRPHAEREPFLTLDFAPGAAAQVDWADFGFALPGCPRRVSAFVMALCYSRMLYLEFVLSQGMGSFLRCMERGLRFFGGTTTVDIFDNMKTVVLSHTPTATVFNPRFLEYARTRHFVGVACNVRRGNEKGRVERPIGFIRERFWPGCRPTDLLDLNVKASTWRDTFANNRVHEVTGKVPSLVFGNQERQLLRPVGEIPFNTDDVESAGVTKSFRVRFDRCTYSVPPQLVGQNVVVRANDEAVAIFLGPKQIAMHRRSWEIGQDIEHPAHRESALAKKPRATAGALPPGLVGLGDIGANYFKVLAAGSRSVHREIVRLTLLVELFGASATSTAVAEVMHTGHVGAEYVEYVLRHKRGLAPQAPPLRLGDPELDAISFSEPDLSRYDRIVERTRDPGEPSQDPQAQPPDAKPSVDDQERS
jgi:transposase